MRIDVIADLDALDFDKGDGLIPVIVQHADSGEVLMLGFADRPALERTLRDGRVTFYSRTRERQWQKGESSGHHLGLVSLHADCDADTVLARAEPTGPTCHTGARSCFEAPPVLRELADVIDERARETDPGGYTGRLLADANLRWKKLAEEALELALACQAAEASRGVSGAAGNASEAAGDAAEKAGDAAGDAGSPAGGARGGTGERVPAEAADLLYHLLVACRAAGVDLDRVLAALRRRRS